jgi:hypothetical protein
MILLREMRMIAVNKFFSGNMSIKKSSRTLLLILPLSLILITGCEKVVFEPMGALGDQSFAADIQPILTKNCTGCHPPTKGLDLTVSHAYNELVPKYAAVSDASNPEGSKLYIQLTGTSHKPRTSDVEKQQILKWISQGVPNN